MNKKLYYICNSGCDDSTHGIAELTAQEFEVVKQLVINLNKNSYYGCMPTISIYEISWDDLREDSPDNVNDYYRFYFLDKIYTWKDDDCGRSWLYKEPVI